MRGPELRAKRGASTLVSWIWGACVTVMMQFDEVEEGTMNEASLGGMMTHLAAKPL